MSSPLRSGRLRLVAVLVLAASAPVLSGCATSTGIPVPVVSKQEPPTVPPPALTTPPPATVPPATAPPTLVLRGDGLGLAGADGADRTVPLGSPITAAQQAVEQALGPLTPLALPDCPQGPRTALTSEGFRLLTDGQTLTGWADDGSQDRNLASVDGVGVGSRLDDLQSASPDVQVVPIPDGATFRTAEGLSGQLEGADPTSQILSVWAGETCPLPPVPDPTDPGDPANADPANPDPANPDPANPDPANPDAASPPVP